MSYLFQIMLAVAACVVAVVALAASGNGRWAIVLPLAFAPFIFWMMFNRADNILRTWARKNRLQLVSKSRVHVGGGQVHYRVTVRDRDGNLRTGLARCGHYLTGLFNNTVYVTWEK